MSGLYDNDFRRIGINMNFERQLILNFNKNISIWMR